MSTSKFEEEAPAPALPAGYAQTSCLVATVPEATGILAVDVSHLAYRSSFAYRELTTADGRFSGHVYGSCRLLLAALQNHLPPGRWLPVFAYDGVNAREVRQKILPAYKAKRGERYNPVPDVSAVTNLVTGLHIKHPDREGDDALAWAAERLARADRPFVVLSGDRDIWALRRYPGVQVWSPNLKRFVTSDDVTKAYSVTAPERIYLAKALFGDSSDGIRGLGFFKKQMAPHLQHPDCVDVESLYQLALAADKKVTTQNTKNKLELNRATVETHLQVVTPITTGFEPHHVRRGTNDQALFEAAMHHYECRTLVDKAPFFFGAEFYSGVQEEGV